MTPDITLMSLYAACRRQVKPFVACVLAGLALGFTYNLLATPRYTAKASLLIGERPLRVLRDSSSQPENQPFDPAIVDSEAEVLRSDAIGLAVIRNLKLLDEPNFIPPPGPLDKVISSITGWFLAFGTDPSSDDYPKTDPLLKKELGALKLLNRNFLVTHVPRTFIIEIQYESKSPALSARIVNAFTDAYFQQQDRAHAETAKRAQQWLEDRAEELRRLSADADLKAQKFRGGNDLLSSKGVTGSEQKFTELLTQLVQTQAATAQAKARYLKVKQIVEARNFEEDVVDTLNNPVITDIRIKYTTAAKRMMEFEHKVGPKHAAVRELRRSLEILRELLFSELRRVAATYQSDYQIAEAREKELESVIAQQKTDLVSVNRANVQLRQLEQKAEGYKTLYQTYIQNYQEAAEQQNLHVTFARVISAAVPPLERSHPKTSLVLALGGFAGVMCGVAIGLTREFLDQSFRTGDQVERDLQLPLLGMLPAIGASKGGSLLGSGFRHVLRSSVDHPNSSFSNNLRSAKQRIEVALVDQSVRSIGVISLLPGEGKTTVAKNLASQFACEGAKTLLIDADVYAASLSHAIEWDPFRLAPPAHIIPGLADRTFVERDSNLNFVSCKDIDEGSADARQFIDRIFGFLGEAFGNRQREYDVIFVDLPPMGLLAEFHKLLSSVDGLILVIAWGDTSRHMLRSALAHNSLLSKKILGAVLNKVDFNTLSKYTPGPTEDYYSRRQSRRAEIQAQA